MATRKPAPKAQQRRPAPKKAAPAPKKPAPKKAAPAPKKPAPAPVEEVSGGDEQQFVMLNTIEELPVETLTAKGSYYEADGQLIPKNQVLAIRGKTLFVRTQKNLGALVDITEKNGKAIYVVDEDGNDVNVVELIPGSLTITLLPPLGDEEPADDGEAYDDPDAADPEDGGEYDDPDEADPEAGGGFDF